jgi:predicted membrane protein
LIFLSGIVFLALILLIKDRAMQGPLWKKIVNWVLFAIFIFVTYTGISFIYINSSVGHVKATSTAVFVFLGTALVLAIILARLLGYLDVGKLTQGLRKEKANVNNEA